MTRLNSKLKHNPRPDTKDKYKQASHTLHKETRKAYWAYLENIIDYTSEPNTQDRHTKQKRFWSFIKSTGNDSSGISPLRHQGVVHSDPQAKLTFLLNMSHPYTHEQPGSFPNKGPSPYSSMPDIIISATGIQHPVQPESPQSCHPPYRPKGVKPPNLTYTRNHFQQITANWPSSERLEGSECRPNLQER